MIEYDLSAIKDSDITCWEYSSHPESGDEWEETDGGIYIRMCPITFAIIATADEIKLTNISQGNMLEWVYRMNSLFDAGKSLLAVETREGEVPIRLRPQDIRKHIGLQIEGTCWTKEKFDAYIRQIRMHRHLSGDDFDV